MTMDIKKSSEGILEQYQSQRPLPEIARGFIILDGLRGIAALIIAVRHAPFLWQAGYPTGFLHTSYLAVDFFFVLSGFVLAYAYDERFRKGMSARQFMSMRLIRLYPLYFFALLVSLITYARYLHWGTISSTEFIFNAFFAILFMPSPFSAVALFPMNFPAWSLFFELTINFAFGLAGKRLTISKIVVVTCGAGLTLMLAVSLGWLGFGPSDSPMDAGLAWGSFNAALARVSYSFFAGVLAYRLWKASGPKIDLPPAILVAGLCAVLVAYPQEKYRVSFDLLATLIVFPTIVFLGASSTVGKYTSRLFAFLGSISYAVYVLQVPLYNLMLFANSKVTGKATAELSPILAAISIAFVVWAAIILDKYFDRPVRRMMANFLK
jgi:peptidoglycan/LPS O-acetylase OafA/YrhL